MQKLKLDLGELEVQSFATTDAASGREGTVHGMIVSTDQPDCMNSGGFGAGFCLPGVYGNLGVDPAFGTVAGIGLDSGQIACGDNGLAAFPQDAPLDIA